MATPSLSERCCRSIMTESGVCCLRYVGSFGGSTDGSDFLQMNVMGAVALKGLFQNSKRAALRFNAQCYVAEDHVYERRY